MLEGKSSLGATIALGVIVIAVFAASRLKTGSVDFGQSKPQPFPIKMLAILSIMLGPMSVFLAYFAIKSKNEAVLVISWSLAALSILLLFVTNKFSSK